jgi:hypothetical protein
MRDAKIGLQKLRTCSGQVERLALEFADEDEHPDDNETNDMSVRFILIRGKWCPGRDDGANCD